jgi:glycogen synthase
MRVLFWSELFWPHIGGIELLAARFVPAMHRRGHQLAVVTSHGELELPDEAEYHGVPVHRFPFRAALGGGNITQLFQARQSVARLKRTFAPDLIHLYGVGAGAVFHFNTGDAHPAPVLLTIHAEVLRDQAGGRDSLLEKALRSARWVSCVSTAVRGAALGLVPEIEPYSSVIHNGAETPAVPPTPPPPGAPRVLCLGRLVADKGYDLAVAAFADVLRRFPEARLVVAGDGPMRAALERQTAELGLTGAVEFVGWVPADKVPELINSTSLVVMPSRREGLPLVGVQAAQMARPVVATRVGGLPELIVDGATGVLVDREDSRALAEAISFFLDRPSEIARYGEAARTRVADLFSWSRHVDAYDALYHRLAGRPAER